jgi:hypothetical protein
MPSEYLKDGDIAFVGLNSRDNPSSLPQGIVTQSQNFRLDRGVATVRKGLQRKTIGALIGQTIYGCGSYLDSTGQEIFLFAVNDGLYRYNPQTETLSAKINFPVGETITTQDGCDVVHAIDKVFISRGIAKRPLYWDLGVTITAMTALGSAVGTGGQFPNCSGLLYYANRLIAIGADHSVTLPSTRSRDTVCVSNFLEWTHWDLADAFTFNNGGNDEVVAISPWTINEALVLMRNSIFYASFGVDRYVSGDGLSTDSFTKTLVTDIGCMAKKSVVQANGGIVFLSDNGVYFLQPSQVGANDAMRLLTLADPLSAPIDDVIQRINRAYAHRAVATYWNNRYYLAVPLDGSSDNNAVLVFNFILKNWESVDVYPAGFDAFDFLIGKKNNQRRMFVIDTDEGVFLAEQLNWDEYGGSTGTPILPFYLPATLSPLSFTPNQITGLLKTRRYTFNTLGDKRFSTAETELVCDAGSQITTVSEVVNPDAITTIDVFGSQYTEDSKRSVPVRKIGTGVQLTFTTANLRPSIRSSFIYATSQIKNNQSKY